MKRVLLAYLPVLHDGVEQLLKRHVGKVDKIWVVGTDGLLEKLGVPFEIRRLSPVSMVRAIGGMFDVSTGHDRPVGMLASDMLGDPAQGENWPDTSLIVTNDVVGRALVAKYFPRHEVEWDSTFLHHDSSTVMSTTNVEYDRTIALSELQSLADRAVAEGRLTTSAWREVGVVFFRDGQVILAAHNHHLPTEETVFVEGDVRDFVEAGKHPEICSAIHGEKSLIAQAARYGIALDGAEVFITVFPCAPCAQQLCEAGIKRLYYMGGNAYVRVDKVLKDLGVEIIYVHPN